VNDLVEDEPDKFLGKVRSEFDEGKQLSEIGKPHDKVGYWVVSSIIFSVSSINFTLKEVKIYLIIVNYIEYFNDVPMR